MKIKKMKKKLLVSILLVNYNNAKYLIKSINSCLNQDYKYKEIIVIDDNSTDNSIEVIKSFKNKISYFVTKNRTDQGSFNQMNAYYLGFKKSKGEVIFFLDSDDYFKKNKISLVIDEFKKNYTDIIFDKPVYKFKHKQINKNFIQKRFILSSWPRFTPQSCISLRRNYAKEIFNCLLVKRFKFVWLDFRIAIYSFLKFNKIHIINKYLTYYRQIDTSASKEFNFKRKNWWIRRNQAHNFFSFINKKLKLKDRLTVDKLVTKTINLFLSE